MTLNKYHLGIRIHCMLDGTGQKRLLLTYALILFEKLVLEVGLNEVNLLTIAKLPTMDRCRNNRMSHFSSPNTP